MIDARGIVTNPGGNWSLIDSSVIGISVHHSAATTWPASATIEQEQAAIRAIDRYHVDQNYGGIGYHAIAFASGRTYQVGSYDGARSGVAFRNHELIHVCAIGTFTDVLPAKPQLDGIAECIRAMCNFYGRSLEVRGHNLWAVPGQGTICAGTLNGFDWNGYMTPSQSYLPGEVAMACVSAAQFYRLGYDFSALMDSEKEILRLLARKV